MSLDCPLDQETWAEYYCTVEMFVLPGKFLGVSRSPLEFHDPLTVPCLFSCLDMSNQYTAQVVLGRGDNRATFNFLPELFSEGSKAVK